MWIGLDTGFLGQIRGAAVMAWRMGDKGPEVLLITSRETGRWVLPKGWPMKGRSGAECALREAFEEAGVAGACSVER